MALGWTGANCVKWLSRIVLMDRPYEGFFMDNVYRLFQKGQDSKTGEVIKGMKLKSIITQPQPGETLTKGAIVILGAAYAGESDVERVEVSTDGGETWRLADFIGPYEPYAWRQWQFIWEVREAGPHTLMACATDCTNRRQPMQAERNMLGYCNNGVKEHTVRVTIV